MPAVGGPATQITREGGRFAMESLDGKTLYYTKDYNFPTTLRRVPVTGGQETQILDTLSAAVNFAVAEEGIYWLAADDIKAGATLQFYDFRTGRARRILRLDVPLQFGASVSPDKRWFVYTQADQKASDLMLVENFR